MISQIRFAGIGGQGVILAGLILGEASAIEGLNVIQSQDYGSQSRGGHSIADVIVGDVPIYDLIVTKADILVALAQLGYKATEHKLKRDGLLIVDTDLVKPDREFIGAQFTKIVEERVGLALTVSIVALGYFVARTGIIKKDSVGEAIRRRVPEGTVEINLKAFNVGYELGAK